MMFYQTGMVVAIVVAGMTLLLTVVDGAVLRQEEDRSFSDPSSSGSRMVADGAVLRQEENGSFSDPSSSGSRNALQVVDGVVVTEDAQYATSSSYDFAAAVDGVVVTDDGRSTHEFTPRRVANKFGKKTTKPLAEDLLDGAPQDPSGTTKPLAEVLLVVVPQDTPVDNQILTEVLSDPSSPEEDCWACRTSPGHLKLTNYGCSEDHPYPGAGLDLSATHNAIFATCWSQDLGPNIGTKYCFTLSTHCFQQGSGYRYSYTCKPPPAAGGVEWEITPGTSGTIGISCGPVSSDPPSLERECGGPCYPTPPKQPVPTSITGSWEEIGSDTSVTIKAGTSWSDSEASTVGTAFTLGLTQGATLKFGDQVITGGASESWAKTANKTTTQTRSGDFGITCTSPTCEGRTYQWQASGEYTNGSAQIVKSCDFHCVPFHINVGPQCPKGYCDTDACQCCNARWKVDDNSAAANLLLPSAGGFCFPGCDGDGTPCTDSAKCCSGTCYAGVCDSGCGAADNVACKYNSECCSRLCSGGICFPECDGDGIACTDSAKCCSEVCYDGVCDSECGAATGVACSDNDMCCSGFCSMDSNTDEYTC